MIRLFFYSFVACILIIGCATHTNIEPVGKGKSRVEINLGGPIVSAFKAYIPIPYLSAGLNHGLTENLDINGGIHIMPLFYKVAGLELGGTWFPVINQGYIPTIGIDLKALFFSSLKSGINDRFRLYPVLSPSFAWKMPGGMIYCGSHITVPFSKVSFDAENPGYILSPFLGFRWNVSDNYKFFTEVKWHGVNFETYQLATEYVHPANYGALGVFLTLERNF